MDLRDRIDAGGERGLLGLAFHPDFATNRRLFVHYSRAGDGATVVSELTRLGRPADGRSGQRARAAHRARAVRQPQRRAAGVRAGRLPVHRAGRWRQWRRPAAATGRTRRAAGQDPAHRRGWRSTVAAGPTAMPADNPFGPGGANPGGGRPEIWAAGPAQPVALQLRPGWRRPVHRRRRPGRAGRRSTASRRDSAGGENYGWNVMEGRHCFGGDCDQTGFVKPIAEYGHDLGCSVTGGYVYRGDGAAGAAGRLRLRRLLLRASSSRCRSTRAPSTPSGCSIPGWASPQPSGPMRTGRSTWSTSGGGVYHVLVDG